VQPLGQRLHDVGVVGEHQQLLAALQEVGDPRRDDRELGEPEFAADLRHLLEQDRHRRRLQAGDGRRVVEIERAPVRLVGIEVRSKPIRAALLINWTPSCGSSWSTSCRQRALLVEPQRLGEFVFAGDQFPDLRAIERDDDAALGR
jgi:hypothetical protein